MPNNLKNWKRRKNYNSGACFCASFGDVCCIVVCLCMRRSRNAHDTAAATTSEIGNAHHIIAAFLHSVNRYASGSVGKISLKTEIINGVQISPKPCSTPRIATLTPINK